MEVNIIDNKDAKEFEDFILPGVTERNDWEQMTVFVAHDEGQVKGMLVAKVEKDEVEIASIAVAEDEQRKKVGSELIISSITWIGMMLHPCVEKVSNVYVTFSMALPCEEWDALDAFLKFNGFECADISRSFMVSFADLKESKKLGQIKDRVRNELIMSYDEIPGTVLRQFSNDLVNTNTYPPIVTGNYDKDLSLFFVKKDMIEACILMRAGDENNIYNEWVYINPKSNDKLMIMELFAKCIDIAKKIYSDDAKVHFVVINDAGEKLLMNMAPSAKEELQIRGYERRMPEPGEFEYGVLRREE